MMLSPRIATPLVLALQLTLAAACQRDTSPVRTTSAAGVERSPSNDSADARGNSLIRVVNAVQSGKVVRAVIGQESLFGDIGPEAVTDYKEVSAAMPEMVVGEPGHANPVSLRVRDRVFLEGGRYTVFLVAADMSHNSLIVLRDDLKPDSGKARIRVLHAAPGAPTLRVMIEGRTDTLIRSIGYGSDAGFLDVPPGRVTLRFQPTGGTERLLRLANIELTRGTSTTVVVTGATSLGGFSFRDVMLAPKPKA